MVVVMTATATTYEALGGHGDTHRALGTRGYSEHPPFSRWGPGARRGTWLLGSATAWATWV